MKDIKNLVWIDRNRGILECEMLIDNKWIQYAAHKDDVEPLGPKIVAAAESGEYGDIPVKTYLSQIPNFQTPLSVDKSKFLTTLVLMDLVDEDSIVESAATNKLPPVWLKAISKSSAENQLCAKISFSADQRVSEYTDWVQLLIMYNVIDREHVRAALRASI